MTEQKLSKLRASGFWKEADYIEELENKICAMKLQIRHYTSVIGHSIESLDISITKIDNYKK